MNRLKSILISTLLVAPFTTGAQAEPREDIKPAVSYVVDLNITVTKVCIGDQYYLITRQSNGASGITPALRKGKPEQCDSKNGPSEN
jgi:hypothetical protein